MNTPSPLSRPTTAQNDGRPFSAASSTMSHSPAAAAMAAINEKETGNKSMKSRLRRAFSFGSAAELNRAGTTQESAAERAKARRQQFINELDEEQDAIAQKQEKSGLGRGIYGNRSKMFTGSTDNLSISSTASSASIMLRKMGNNVKKSGRSLKGLFRPKSVVGVPSIDNPMEASVGPVSMVNVEAEREQVNVNINPRDQPGGGTGYPKLERNSVDATSRMGQPLARLDTQTSSIAGTTFDGRSDLEEMGQFRSSSAPPLKKGILKSKSRLKGYLMKNDTNMSRILHCFIHWICSIHHWRYWSRCDATWLQSSQPGPFFFSCTEHWQCRITSWTASRRLIFQRR